MVIQKIQAALLHFGLSFVVISSFVLFATQIWYPSPFLEISGLLGILLILVTVDLLLGPLLTLVVYKPNKPYLKIDLGIIAAVQLAALGYGMYTIHQGHPAYIAFAVDRFTLINIADVNPHDAKYPELRASGWWKPIMTYSQAPTDPKEKERIMFEVLSGKPDIDARPEYYEPFAKFAAQVMEKGLSPTQLSSTPQNQQKLTAFLQRHGKTAANYAYLPLVGKEKDVVWVWDKASQQPVGTLDIDPWKLATQVANAP